MSELISGEAAKLAWANGEDVEVNIKSVWLSISSMKGFRLVDFDDNFSRFRIKPRSITINGIECQSEVEALKLVKEFFRE